MTAHLEELTLLLYAIGDLLPDQIALAKAHLGSCDDCSVGLVAIREIDSGLRGFAAAGALLQQTDFKLNDPFRRRPIVQTDLRKSPRDLQPSIADALAASRNAAGLSESILGAAKAPNGAGALLSSLSLDVAEHRFALLYALQEGGRQSAENPIRIKTFAGDTIDWLRRNRSPAGDPGPAEALVPRLTLRAHAHMLYAIASLWTKDFLRARTHLIAAYGSFARAGADDVSLALVELAEAQRRAFGGEGRTALILARRARETFEARGMDDYAARTIAAVGLAHASLGEREAAIRAYRTSLPVFERHELWSNYVGALNGAATCLTELGRFEEARRDYARALRRFSQERHRYLLGYLRIGFAEALFAAERYSEAAASASRAVGVFAEAGLRPHQLIAMLLEVESWARHGDLDRARRRLDIFSAEVDRDQSLDPAVQRELAAALSGANPDYKAITSLRLEVRELLQRRYAADRA